MPIRRQAGIALNPEKTQWWCNAHGHPPLQVGEIQVPWSAELKVLGVTFAPDGATEKSSRRHQDEFMQKLRRATVAVSALPAPSCSKERAISAITLASALYCPWHFVWHWKAVAEARRLLLRGLLPHHVTGPRLVSVLTTHVLCGHRSDPLIRTAMRMTSMIEQQPTLVDGVARAMQGARHAGNLPGALAHLLHSLNIRMHGQWAEIDGVPRAYFLSICHGDVQSWQHAWRVLLRLAVIRATSAHRREFQQLRLVGLDEGRSFALH